MNEIELVQGCLKQDRKIQEMLYRHFADEMFSVAMIYTDSYDDSCDIVQQSFIKVFKKIDSFKFESTLHAWIRRIVVNTSLDFLRKKKRELENQTAFISSCEIDTDVIIPEMSAKEILGLIKKLPEKAALVLKLYALEGFAHKEIAEKLEISEGTSKSQLNRARTLLKHIIDEHYGKS
jgi:RNA polymerase sigma factor (sigma-70 family)